MSEKREPKVHFADFAFSSKTLWAWVECELCVDRPFFTRDTYRVTCGNCKRTRAFREAEEGK